MARAKPGIKGSEFAELLGITVRQLTNYRAEGMPHRMANGVATYVPSECIKWLLARERDLARAAAVPGEASERVRKTRADADLRELELLERRRQLVPTVEFQEALDAIIGGFVAVAAGQLQRYEREIVQVATLAAARGLTEQMHDALMLAARRYADQLEAESVSDQPAA